MRNSTCFVSRLTSLLAPLAVAALAPAVSAGAVPPPPTGPAHRPAAAAPADGLKTFTGTLTGGGVAIGGETTGWRLAADGAAGGMEVDVSAVEADAKANDGKRVTVTGTLVEKEYVERGKVQILVAKKIVPAPPKEKK